MIVMGVNRGTKHLARFIECSKVNIYVCYEGEGLIAGIRDYWITGSFDHHSGRRGSYSRNWTV
jgi:hypothetical protein